MQTILIELDACAHTQISVSPIHFYIDFFKKKKSSKAPTSFFYFPPSLLYIFFPFRDAFLIKIFCYTFYMFAYTFFPRNVCRKKEQESERRK